MADLSLSRYKNMSGPLKKKILGKNGVDYSTGKSQYMVVSRKGDKFNGNLLYRGSPETLDHLDEVLLVNEELADDVARLERVVKAKAQENQFLRKRLPPPRTPYRRVPVTVRPTTKSILRQYDKYDDDLTLGEFLDPNYGKPPPKKKKKVSFRD